MDEAEWAVVTTEEFHRWFGALTEAEKASVIREVTLLTRFGPRLGFPHTSKITTSRHGHMRELRVQHAGRAIRVLYAFDPRRAAVLLLGGDKSGDDRWYDSHVPAADRLYDAWLDDLKRKERP